MAVNSIDVYQKICIVTNRNSVLLKLDIFLVYKRKKEKNFHEDNFQSGD